MAFQAQLPVRIHIQPFLEQQASLQGARPFHGKGNAPITVDHAVPGEIFPIRKRMQDADHLARAAGAAGQGRDLTERSDLADGYPLQYVEYPHSQWGFRYD